MAEHDDRGVVCVLRGVILIVAVEPNARPHHRHAAVRLGCVKDHLVLSVDAIKPCLEGRVSCPDWVVARRLRLESKRGQPCDSGGRRGGETTKKPTPVHAKPPQWCDRVGYATSGGGSPLGQSFSLPRKSGRGCAFTNAATSNAWPSVGVPGVSNGMLRLMNSAAVRTRVIPAPTLYDSAPHNGGAPAVPSPAAPWHFAHDAANTRAPAAVSALKVAHFCSRALEPPARGATVKPRERNAKYATMSRMSGPAGSSAAPFMLRRKQSFTRYSIVSTTPLRARYCGYRANTPIHEPVSRRPSSRWQLVQRSVLPTWLGKLSRVAGDSARPRRTASPYGPAGMTESAAAAVREGAAFEQPARLVMPRKTAKVLGRTRRDIPAF